MTNIITVVVLNYFYMPRIMFLVSVKMGHLFDDFAGPQLLLMMISSLRNGRSHKQSDYCGHHGLTCLSLSGIFVKKTEGTVVISEAIHIWRVLFSNNACCRPSQLSGLSVLRVPFFYMRERAK